MLPAPRKSGRAMLSPVALLTMVVEEDARAHLRQARKTPACSRNFFRRCDHGDLLSVEWFVRSARVPLSTGLEPAAREGRNPPVPDLPGSNTETRRRATRLQTKNLLVADIENAPVTPGSHAHLSQKRPTLRPLTPQVLLSPLAQSKTPSKLCQEVLNKFPARFARRPYPRPSKALACLCSHVGALRHGREYVVA